MEVKINKDELTIKGLTQREFENLWLIFNINKLEKFREVVNSLDTDIPFEPLGEDEPPFYILWDALNREINNGEY